MMIVQELIDELKKRLEKAEEDERDCLFDYDMETANFYGGRVKAFEEILALIKEAVR
jgi:CRISPR/Cas system-associated endoribonuclease Cas2